MDLTAELAFRQQVFDALTLAVAESGALTRDELTAFPVAGSTHRLLDRNRGIYNPRTLVATLSVVSSPEGPYVDEEVAGGLFRYEYRAGTVQGDNTKLRRAFELEVPIILLRKIGTGVYVPIFPTYVIADDQVNRQFVLAVDELLRTLAGDDKSVLHRRYAERVARHRLHQAEFRGRVLRAYATRCAVCTLRYGRLLDAAYILADSHDDGDPIVANGLSLCKIHHAAYDAQLLGISADYQIAINRAVLEEIGGPMLRHGLQDMHGQALVLPVARRDRPDQGRLASRWDDFQRAN